MHPAHVAVVNHSLESELMPIYKLDSYILIVTGKDRYSFIEGLSTNKIEGNCSTVFTNTAAKIIDHVDVVDKGDFLALVGYGPYKNDLLQHITKRILGQDVSIGDASSNNSVFLSTKDVKVKDSVTKSSTWRGWLLIAPTSEKIVANMSESDFIEYRIQNMIPHQGHEITPNVHPLACGLGHLVHESKGCYIGQEILARMRSRGKQGKELVCLPNTVENATTVGKTHSLAIVRVQSN